MKLFKCQHCGQLLYFENTVCQRCGHALGFYPLEMDLLTLQLTGDGVYASIADARQRFRYCDNARYAVCNWLVEENLPDQLCQACKLNRTIPDISQPLYLGFWAKMETAKHRLVYTLYKLGLPVTSRVEDEENGLAFDFLAEISPDHQVITGHEAGLITINVAEADEAERARHKAALGEPYRTLLGHFRHEVGHYYWRSLIQESSQNLEQFRNLFGDERQDYAAALQQHYNQGPDPEWAGRFVSSYASVHPWEDWAETWAHYLHMMDTLETAFSFGLRISPVPLSKVSPVSAHYGDDPYRQQDFSQLINQWFPLTVAVNSLNRSMGQPDFYPFVIAPPVVEKLSFVHSACCQHP